ncbi:hypothetical protein F3Y22_tig00011662pilonHSYRG00057 [Hibiscus syriacus]|uniref:Clp R domain-containing protein n=1 Tax=Hibiscus syriacus TaxID=106335 RepID=A0A6A3C506_HIBSY|nr:hypothetical protein F3Y22_tig00011662pilonHSYRG00057 [Hibiscus syriacus]
MMYILQAPGLRIRSSSGFRGSNSLDNKVRSGQDFHSKDAISVSSGRGRGSRCVPKAMFERFTEDEIKVIMVAQKETRRLGHNFMCSDHVLLGLIREGIRPTGIAAKVLISMGIKLQDARVEVEKIIGRGRGCVDVENGDSIYYSCVSCSGTRTGRNVPSCYLYLLVHSF